MQTWTDVIVKDDVSSFGNKGAVQQCGHECDKSTWKAKIAVRFIGANEKHWIKGYEFVASNLLKFKLHMISFFIYFAVTC